MSNRKTYKTLDRVELTAGLLSVLFIPIQKQVVVVLMLIWLLAALINLVISLKNGEKIKFLKWEFLAFAVLVDFYLLHVIGMFYSSNLEYGFFDLEIKMSLFIIPLLIFVRAKFYSDKLLLFFKALIIGLLISFILNLLMAYLAFSEDGNRLHFYYSRLSSEVHPSYMALYVSLALIAIIHYWKKVQIVSNLQISFLLKFLISVVLLSYLFLLSSKAGIIAFSIATTAYVALHLVKRLKPIAVLFISIFMLTIPVLIVSLVPNISVRFKDVAEVFKKLENLNVDSESGSVVRLAIIKADWQLSVDNLPWGVGTGDVKETIVEYHQSNGSVYITERYLNAHNQFAQSTIALGILGLLLLLLFFVFGFVHAFRQNKVVLSIFLLLLFIHFLFESMFETQAGVVFIVLFYSLLLADAPLIDGRGMGDMNSANNS